MRIACCISIQNVRHAKNHGYDFVELSAKEIMGIDEDDWASAKNQILSCGIPVLGFNSFCDDHHPLVGPDVNRMQLSHYLDKVIERARDLNCRNIGIGAPKARMLPDDYSYELATAQMENFLQTAAAKAAMHHINILYEALHPYGCNFGNATLEAYHLVKKLNMSNLKMVWDVYHSLNAGEHYAEVAGIFDVVEHIHICSWDKALNRYYLLDKDQEYLDELMVVLAAHHYDKTLSIEASDADFANTGANSVAMIQRSLSAKGNEQQVF